jgi:two-component system sensor histidine kinase/response regulator
MMSRQPGTNLPVLDVEGGFARLLGKCAIYYSALKLFATHIQAARAVAAQLAAGDHAGAYLAIHTLKGAAGLLGAGEVQAIATAVETALARGHAVDALLDDLAAALQRVQALIEVAAPKDAAAPAAPVPAEAMRNVPALLDRLAAVLDEGDGTAIDMLDKYGLVLEKALGTAAWETVMAAARDYDFERAFVALRDARSAAML